MQERIRRLRKLLADNDIQGLLVRNRSNYTYLTGFSGSVGTLLITENDAWLLVDFRYWEQAEKESPHLTVCRLQGAVWPAVAELLEEEKIERLGFESRHMSYSEFCSLHEVLENTVLVPTEDLVENRRMVKDEGEMQLLRHAASLADEGFRRLIPLIKPGVSEGDLALELEFFLRRAGADAASFPFIVASGPRAALPHGKASSRRLSSGELVVIDFGAVYQGYCSDMTRTVCLGKALPWQREIYTVVRSAQAEALQKIKAGMTAAEADGIARRFIKEEGYGDCFGHGLGHGIGREPHEAPTISPRGKGVLEEGMVFTVEPGVYLQHRGGVRIEDMVVLKEHGVEVMTSSSKEFWEI